MGLFKNIFHKLAYKRAEKEFLEEVKNAQMKSESEQDSVALSEQSAVVLNNGLGHSTQGALNYEKTATITPAFSSKNEQPSVTPVTIEQVQAVAPSVSATREGVNSNGGLGNALLQKDNEHTSMTNDANHSSGIAVKTNALKTSSSENLKQSSSVHVKTEKSQDVLDAREAHKKWLQEWLAKRSALEDKDDAGDAEE